MFVFDCMFICRSETAVVCWLHNLECVYLDYGSVHLLLEAFEICSSKSDAIESLTTFSFESSLL